MGSSRSSGVPRTCFMCERPARSDEHVPPQCLFPEQKDLPPGTDYRRNLITVPACDEHNFYCDQPSERTVVRLVFYEGFVVHVVLSKPPSGGLNGAR